MKRFLPLVLLASCVAGLAFYAIKIANNSTAPAAWTGLKGKIAFVSERDTGRNSQIYAMNANGTGVARLTTNSADDYNPCFWPDGKKIVYASRQDIALHLYLMSADGSGLKKLTQDRDGLNGNPLFSADGKKIVFASGSGISVINADGTHRINFALQLQSATWQIAGFPCFSPDGKKIVFALESGDKPRVMDLVTMNVDGSGQKRLATTPNFSEDEPRFSPDGKKSFMPSKRKREVGRTPNSGASA